MLLWEVLLLLPLHFYSMIFLDFQHRTYTGEDRHALELLRTSRIIDEFQQDLHSKDDYRLALSHLLEVAPELIQYMNGHLLILGGDHPTWKYNKKIVAEVQSIPILFCIQFNYTCNIIFWKCFHMFAALKHFFCT